MSDIAANTQTQRGAAESAAEIAAKLRELSDNAADLAIRAGDAVSHSSAIHTQPFLVMGLTVFVLACIIGYYVVWRVTPALHSPLMGVTNAISSVIIVGAVIALGAAESGISTFFGFLAVVLASVNIFGGFIITRRMLHMFKKRG